MGAVEFGMITIFSGIDLTREWFSLKTPTQHFKYFAMIKQLLFEGENVFREQSIMY